jgi:uncharacterized membrane protein (UPF0127 family)
VVLLSLTLCGCGKSEPAAVVAPKTVADYFEIKVGERPVQMQLALLQSEMQHGLMGRLDLARDSGMLFVYLKPQRMSFWMRNTPLPLDIGFFDAEGKLREIYQLHPYDETPVATRGSNLQFALEMNQGWFKANDIRPGEQLDLDQLKAALEARDYRPKQFGLE